MKNRIIKSILALLLFLVSMPVMGQDFLEIHFNDGTQQVFYLEGVKEIFTSKFDADGIQHSDYEYQHITTNYNKYVFPLNDIDRISFTKFDEEKTQKSFISAMSGSTSALSDCSTIEDAEQKLSQIKSIDGVENAWSDGHDLHIKIKDWETISFHFNHYNEEVLNASYNTTNKIRALKSELKKLAAQNEGKLSIVIANQQHKDMGRKGQINLFNSLLEEFSNCGFSVKYEENPTIENFFTSKMYEYDIVLLMTHGAYSNGSHSFITGDELGKTLKIGDEAKESVIKEWYNKMVELNEKTKEQGPKAIWFDYVDEIRTVPHWVGYLRINELFFDKPENGGLSEGSFRPNSIFFNCACHSMDGEDGFINTSLASKLIKNHGLGLYLGYTKTNYHSEHAGTDFLHSMLLGKSARKSFSELKGLYRVESDKEGACLYLYSEGDVETEKFFLFPTVTKQIEQTTAQNAFNSSGYVEVEGFTTCIDPNADDAVEMGFQYSTNENFSPASSVVSSDVIKLTKPLDNGNGNVQFRAQLTGLQPGNTYHYRAYTYDGLNYNYGEPCSFEISGGETNITEGLVAYYPFNGNANDASGYENHGTPSAKVVLSEGVNGDSNGAYQFGGYNNPGHIHVPNSESLKFSDGATFSAYFKVTSWTGMDANGNKSSTKGTFCIMAKSHDTRGWTILCSGNDQKLHVEGFNFGGWGSINTDMPGYYLNKWTHVAVVFGNGAARLYVDGQLVKEKETTLEFAKMNGEDLYIGKYSDKWYPFNGVIDEVRIYNRALNDEEIMELSRYSE